MPNATDLDLQINQKYLAAGLITLVRIALSLIKTSRLIFHRTIRGFFTFQNGFKKVLNMLINKE